MNLASTTRAQQNSILAGIDTGTLASLLLAASRQIERYCHRSFALQQYTEYLSGSGQPYDLIQLRQFPVRAIDRLATRPFPVLSVINTDSSTNQRATVGTTTGAIVLLRVASGVSTSSTLAYTTYPTVTAMAAAITALGNGWSATAAPGYELYPSADFRPLQGAITAMRGAARLECYIEELDSCGATCGGWRLNASTGELSGVFPQGHLNIQCDYTAGFASNPDSLPGDIQEACVQLAKDLYSAGKTDWTTTSTKIGPYSQTTAAAMPAMSSSIRALLAPYVDHSKIIHGAA